MAKEIKVPQISEGVETAVISEILVSKGDKIEEDQSVISVETDKATAEVPATSGGTIKEIKVSEGDEVNVGDVIIILEDDDDSEEKEEEKTIEKEEDTSKKKKEDSEKDEEESDSEENKKGKSKSKEKDEEQEEDEDEESYESSSIQYFTDITGQWYVYDSDWDAAYYLVVDESERPVVSGDR